MMNKSNDIIETYLDPANEIAPMGTARLIKKKATYSNLLEMWDVEFLDKMGKSYSILIKKDEKV